MLDEDAVKCPNCGSTQISAISDTETTTKTKTKGFGCIKSIIGLIIFQLPGLLCGLCGMGKSKSKTTTTTKLSRVCLKCGYKF